MTVAIEKSILAYQIITAVPSSSVGLVKLVKTNVTESIQDVLDLPEQGVTMDIVKLDNHLYKKYPLGPEGIFILK